MKKIYLISVSVLFFQSFYSQSDGADKNLSQKKSEELERRFQAHYLKQRQEVQRLKNLGYKEFIYEANNVKQLIGSDENGAPIYYTTLNAGAAKMTKADKLYSGGGLGLNISGQQMTIGLWDYSQPRGSHELLSGKIYYDIATQNPTISRHSTSIAGTMAGNNGDPLARGLAFDSNLRAYDWINDVLEMSAEAYDINTKPSGILVANNSYGFDPIYLQTYQFGRYNQTAKDWDDLMYAKPFFQIVKAAGNAREISPQILPQVVAKEGYDLLEGAGIGKNVLVVASAKKNTSMSTDDNYEVSAFSSYGPTDDGRLKPDLCAPGEDIYSSIETHDKAYGTYRGTSSATAVVSGIATLLQQYWKSVSPSSSYMWSSTLRAILAHTANDKGSEGPDYIYGWGLLDAQRSAQAIHDNIEGIYDGQKKTTLIQEKTLTEGYQYTIYVVPLNSNEPLSATLAWTDPSGNINPNQQADIATPNIVNDLDIKIVKVKADGTEESFYPWRMEGSLQSPKNMYATNQMLNGKFTNNVDNIERVDIKNPDINSTYKIIVSTKSKTVPLYPSHFQNFSIVATNVNFCYKDDLTLISTANDIDTNTPVQNNTPKGKTITASNVIKSPVQGVEYTASEYIRLIPGFTAENGSGFRAYITPCFSTTTPMTYRSQSRSSSPTTPVTEANDIKSNVNIYPNPAKEEANILFRISNSSPVKISIYDQSGKLTSSDVSSGNFPEGNFTKTIDVSNLKAGVYIISVETNDYKETKKLIIK